MNYGYAPVHPSIIALAPAEDNTAESFAIQLYNEVAGAIDIEGMDVLEVGCGRGGGTGFVSRTLGARSVTGVDFTHTGVVFATAQQSSDGVRFLTADAEQLPFRSSSFDVVVNVESSHCYPDFERFLREVERVLRPGGHLLFADLRAEHHLVELRAQVGSARFVVQEEESITAHVVEALRRDTERRLGMMKRSVPRVLHRIARDFLAIEGSEVFEDLKNGKLEYVRLVLRKE